MEYCMELATALKSSLRREYNYLPPHHQFDDNSNNHLGGGVGGADDFLVDCFFDFSNGEFNKDAKNEQILLEEEDEVDEEGEEEEEEKDSLSVSSQDRGVDDDNHSNFSTFSDSFLAGEIAVPADDLAELEWVSHFVDDDSLQQFPLLYPLKSEKHFQPDPQPFNLTKPSCVFPAKIPAKARSKRPRLTGRTWLVAFPLTESSSSNSFTPSSSSSSSSSLSTPIFSSRCLVSSDNFQPPLKKPKRKLATQPGGAAAAEAAVQCQRRCSHCQVQKTPQWRTGPLGAKTLCNACGVRYKSGRLFPEYRPACSPTFSSEVHSNSHRKVVEIRKKKEMTGPESGLNQMMVPSF